MKKRTKKIMLAVLSVALALSLGSLGAIGYRYWRLDREYKDAVDRFVTDQPATRPEATLPMETQPPASIPASPPEATAPPEPTEPPGPTEPPELAPIIVDFEELLSVNPDVVGWIYCEGTVINYPVLQSGDNEKYLRRLYNGKYSSGGSIFVDGINRRDFQDAITILYGHNMRNGSMFGLLQKWSTQAFFDEHPVFWLLTPQQDYKIELLGSSMVSAYSDTYTIYQEPGEALDQFIEKKLAKCVVRSDVVPEPGARYVLLSTCAYWYDGARFVLHGMLVPVDSAGGILIQ